MTPAPVNVVQLPTSVGAVRPDPIGAEVYDFGRPTKVPRDQLRALQMCLETFTRRLTTLFTSSLRQVCAVEQVALEQMAYDDYVSEFEGAAVLAPITLEPLQGTTILQLPVESALVCVDHLLGGPGGEQPQRLPTDVETALLRQLFDQVLGVLRYAFEPIVSVVPSLGAIEYNPQFVQAAGPGDPVIVARLELRIGDLADAASLCMPLGSLSAVLAAATSNTHDDPALGSARSASTARLEDTIGTTPVSVAVSFPPLALDPTTVLGLRPGDLLPLRHSVTVPLAVGVDGARFASAVAGRTGDRLAILVVPPPEATS